MQVRTVMVMVTVRVDGVLWHSRRVMVMVKVDSPLRHPLLLGAPPRPRHRYRL